MSDISTKPTLPSNTTYFISLKNQAPDRTISFAIYQELPNLPPGFQIIAWLQADVPPDAESVVTFNRGEYNVAVVDYHDETGVGLYKSSQILFAKIGQIWELIEKKGVQQYNKENVISTNKQEITISLHEANLAIGESNKIAIVHKKIKKDDSTTFKLPNQYYVGIFYDLVIGQGISSDICHLSKRLDLNTETNHYIVTAKFDIVTSKLSLEIESGERFEIPKEDNDNDRNEKVSKL
ncbi:13846_t:CDS:2 [Ambispora leptoticha]|uniref:13846_t:CDS:1 n=1 Tax=Ambispora leptoticha TaxID=144679 RepID=A0A9N8YQY2_9GLOM|nr:13846_t:CDS:2 [Ambispora leptoticha]